MARNQAIGEKCACAIEKAFEATNCSCPGATFSSQIASTVSAVTSRKLTAASGPIMRFITMIPYLSFADVQHGIIVGRAHPKAAGAVEIESSGVARIDIQHDRLLRVIQARE